MEELKVLGNTKKEIYESILPQISCVVEAETNLIANLANVAAILKEAFNFWWVGFYLVDESNNTLVLGPFQGPLACTRIAKGRGVCGTCWAKESVQLVEDVEKFPGHIACSGASKSEIVLPLKNVEGKIIGVLDIDSEKLANFNSVDSEYLSLIIEILSKII